METKSYVYKVTNKLNNKVYIGKANDPQNRWKKHLYISKYGKKEYGFYYLHAAIIKYGKDNFSFEIIEECNNENDALNKEIYWIKYYNSNNREIGYNLTNGGEGVSGRKYTDEEKKIKSDYMHLYWETHIHPCIGLHISSEHKEKISKANSGKILNNDTKIKISKANSGENNGNYNKIESSESRQNRGKKISETKKKNNLLSKIISQETINKLKLANKEKSSHKLTYDQKDKIIELYKSGKFLKRDLAKQFNVEEKTIIYVLRFWEKVKYNQSNKLTQDQKDQIIELFYIQKYSKKAIAEYIKIPINIIISTIKMYIRTHKIT